MKNSYQILSSAEMFKKIDRREIITLCTTKTPIFKPPKNEITDCQLPAIDRSHNVLKLRVLESNPFKHSLFHLFIFSVVQ